MPLQLGQVLEARYRVDALLAQGGMGAVYRATDLHLGTVVALKENLGPDPAAQRQFAYEASILATLQHPCLPRVIDHFSVPGQGQYLVMDFVGGEDLDRTLANRGRLREAEALAYVYPVLDALEYLHGQNPPVIHRDIKLANIRITPNRRVFLVDFGLAKVHIPSAKTTAGARAVTPGFSPPEQYGLGGTDARSDLYALGATLYALLTGAPPPEATDRTSGAAVLIPPSQLGIPVSPVVEAATLRCLELRAADRFQSAAELRRALQARAKGAPLSPGTVVGSGATTVVTSGGFSPAPAPVAVPPVQPGARAARRPAWLWPAAVAALALVVLVALLLSRHALFPALARVSPSVTTAPPAATITPSPTTSRTPTLEPTVTLLPAANRTPSPTPLPLPSATSSPTAIRILVATFTPTRSPTPIRIATATPTPSPTPAVKPGSGQLGSRIQYPSGGTSATRSGSLTPPGQDVYVLRASSGQILDVQVNWTGSQGGLDIWGQDGFPIKHASVGSSFWRDYLVSTQDYYVRVTAESGTSGYILRVSVPARVNFAPGAISATISGQVESYGSMLYALRASGGQQMQINLSSASPNLLPTIWGFDGTVLKSSSNGSQSWNGNLPSSQDYIVMVTSFGSSASFSLTVTIR